MPDSHPIPVPKRRGWRIAPPYYARALKVGISGDFYTDISLSVPAVTSPSHTPGIRIRVMNANASVFTTLRSVTETLALASWLAECAASPELATALARAERDCRAYAELASRLTTPP